MSTRLFLVRLPHETQENKDVEKEIALFEQLLNGLSQAKQSFTFEAAVPHIGEEIHFFASLPDKMRTAFIRQVYAIWNDAKVDEVADFNIFNHTGFVSGFWLKQKAHFITPIRTYRDVKFDLFSQILGGLAKVNEIGEGAAIQVIVNPARLAGAKREIINAIEGVRKGKSLKDLRKNPDMITVSDFAGAFFPAELEKRKKEEEKQKEVRPDESVVKSLELKGSGQLFKVNLRVLTSAATKGEADEIANGIASGFSQFFEAPDRNELKLIKAKNPRALAREFSFREFSESESMILNSIEIATIFHFPNPFLEIPRVSELKARQAPPPSILPKAGLLIGESVYRDERRNIYITDDDKRRHVYVIGQTGTGKSTLIENMVAEDAALGKGLAVIDPHGELVNHVLGRLSKNRAGDVIVFDPGDLERPIGINMLAHDLAKPEHKTFIVNEMISIFDKLYDLKATGGPMFEQYMRNSLLLLMEDLAHEPATLIEVPRIFTDAEYRGRKLARAKNPTVIDFWEKEASKAGGDAALQNITPYITSKFSNFIANDYVRIIVGQETSSIDFRKIMDEKKILLVNLSKGRIGDINAGLLGMVIVGKILLAALSRVDAPEDRRPDFNAYIDEFQNFTTNSIATILSEARKYRLNLVLAHQFIAQLTDPIKDAVFGNVGSKIVFRVGVEDAEFFEKTFQPVFNKYDLANIDNFHTYVSLLMNGMTTKPFSMRTFPPTKGDPALAQDIIAASRMKYGRERSEVEQGIYERLRN